MTDDPVLSGTRARTLPRANSTYPDGRVCASATCSTVLSVYNEWRFCWQHEPLHGYAPRGNAARTHPPTVVPRVIEVTAARVDPEYLAAAM